jgi:hypothetical protein
LEVLGDEELQELRRRAAALRRDPAAGSAGHVAAKVLGALLVLASPLRSPGLILCADFCTGECL